MSLEASAWAIRQPLPGPTKMVLVVLAADAGRDSACSITTEDLGALAGYSVSTVRRHVADLEGRGLVTVELVVGGPNRYTLTFQSPVYTTPVTLHRQMWDALAAEIPTGDKMTRDERGRWNSAVRQLVDVHVQPTEIAAICTVFRRNWPGMSLTPHAITANLSLLRQNTPKAEDESRARGRVRKIGKERGGDAIVQAGGPDDELLRDGEVRQLW